MLRLLVLTEVERGYGDNVTEGASAEDEEGTLRDVLHSVFLDDNGGHTGRLRVDKPGQN